ncbi:MAG: hypothetical protein EA352_07485 [Gemmatimonadales bacterium]|nr:MAG: hypothetical protein EA352_07485 [Gemmatimonadales bacterium]
MISRRSWTLGFLLAAGGLLAGCSDDTPTSSDPGLLPVEVETFEVLLPAGDFLRDLRNDGGYGSASDLDAVEVRLDEGGFEVRPLLRFGALPGFVDVLPPDSETTQRDSTFTTVGGRLVLNLDTASVTGEGPFEIEVSSLSEPWHPRSASWAFAADTLGGQTEWSSPGGGEARVVGTASWPGPGAEADSLMVEVDTMAIREWTDPERAARGIRLRLLDEGQALRVTGASLRTDNVSEINPDTTILLQPQRQAGTMVYNPGPEAGPDVMLAGGAPAWRSSFRFELPDSVAVASETLCGEGQTCNIALTPDRVVFAGLNLTTMAAPTDGLAPAGEMLLDLRPVLAVDRLPRSPLGSPINPDGVRVPPSAFTADSTGTWEIAMSRYFRDLLRPEAEDLDVAPDNVSLIVVPEPRHLGVARFQADPSAEGAPFLRIILTTSPGVSVR